MYAACTEYKLAHTASDYRKCHAFFKTEAQHPHIEAEGLQPVEYTPERISWPTIYALRAEKVIGVMATKVIPSYGMVAAPFHIAYDLKNHIPVTMRLTDCYEACLRENHIYSYTVIIPNYKPGTLRLFTELRYSQLLKQVLDDRFDVLLVEVPE